jgi:hypothetical protein
VRRLLPLLLVVLVGCGGKKSEIAVHGSVSRTLGNVGIPCGPTDVPPPVQVTFLDGDGHVIGTTTTRAWMVRDAQTCVQATTYKLQLPKVAFYVARITGFEPSEPIAFDDLAQRGFRLDLTEPIG